MKKLSIFLNLILALVLVAGIHVACTDQSDGNGRNPSANRSIRQLYLSDTIPEIDKTREPRMLTAFFGLDNAMPPRSRLIYRNAPGKDGMPIVFTHEIDPETMDPTDFAVTSQNGTVFQVDIASFLPANEEFELRTVLLIGEYGNHPENPPVMVKVVGDLMTRAGQNFKGDSIEVIPLEEGPILSYAEYFTIDENYPYIAEGDGCDCPKEETAVVVRAVWSGGVRALNGEELGENEREAFTVTMVEGSDTIKVKPFKLADLSDNENNIDLCLKGSGIPIRVEVEENTSIDPNDDPNPKTKVKVVSRW